MIYLWITYLELTRENEMDIILILHLHYKLFYYYNLQHDNLKLLLEGLSDSITTERLIIGGPEDYNILKNNVIKHQSVLIQNIKKDCFAFLGFTLFIFLWILFLFYRF
jgi:hypothetical protein